MMQTPSQDPAWYNAVTLTERLASLRAAELKTEEFQVNTEMARRRLERWRAQNPFTEDGKFEQRLAVDGVTEHEFLRLLGEPVEAVHSRIAEPPLWLAEITEAYLRSVASTAEDASATQGTERGKRLLGFLTLIEPLITESGQRLHRGIRDLMRTHAKLPFDPGTIQSILFANLPLLLASQLSRTLALEVNVARLQGLLEGATPQERFNSFIERLRQPEIALQILREYPVLARQLVIHINNWLSVNLEFLQRLCADWDSLRATFSAEKEPGVLTQLDGGQGDSHRGGRSVLIAHFSSGFQVVYKPKSLTIDMYFQKLLDWLNERGGHAPFRTIKVIDRGAYGWTEYVADTGCSTKQELERFYERQGGYLALLYALEATDFHYENLIASGEHPVLIDLESLFHPRAADPEESKEIRFVNSTVGYSVLRVGLLPQRIWLNDEKEGVDLSGMGGAPGQLTPHGVPYWEAVGTDEMRLERRRIAMTGGKNRPTLKGAEVDALQYRDAITRGFEQIYQLLMNHRDELLAENGLLDCFKSVEVRFIVRPTRTYSMLLHESFHPDLLRNALDRDRFFDRLWVGIDYRPYLSRVIPAERRDLQNGDIPMFTARPDSRDIWSSAGEQIKDFLEEPGMELARRHISRLSVDDLDRQLWFINASLTTLSADVDGAQWGAYELAEAKTVADRERLQSAARAVGERLQGLALRDGESISWIGVALVNEKHWTLMPLGIDLYNGLTGVMLFLAYLGEVTGEERYTELARTTLKNLRGAMEGIKPTFKMIGGFDGLGGWIYALTHLSALWDDPKLLAEAEETVELLPELIEQDDFLDVISGTAGCLLSLLALYRYAPSAQTLATAIKCGNHLLERAELSRDGVAWSTLISGKEPLAGFSHGAAGIAYALALLSAVTGDEGYRSAAEHAMIYERAIFSPEAGNWPDLRQFEDLPEAKQNQSGGNFMLAWCHGAPGIGMARLASLEYFDDAATREEINTALKSTVAGGFGHNHSLCHGDLGNLELLLQASRKLEEPQWRSRVERLSSSIVESIEKKGWLCGIPLGVESPGLMTGLAGIGYELLRLSDPERVPSVMLLAPPTPKS